MKENKAKNVFGKKKNKEIWVHSKILSETNKNSIQKFFSLFQ
jgi:hypothetical protein